MHRPLLLRLLPGRVRHSIFARCYRNAARNYLPLYKEAVLDFAPRVYMENLIPGDVISDSIAFTGIYEPATSRRVALIARRGGIMVDVGANLGYFSLLWAAAAPNNRVIAFEAAPRNVQMLRRNVHRNGMDSQVQI